MSRFRQECHDVLPGPGMNSGLHVNALHTVAISCTSLPLIADLSLKAVKALRRSKLLIIDPESIRKLGGLFSSLYIFFTLTNGPHI